MGKFVVTYCAMQFGNPAWHACIFLSEFNPDEQKLEVKERWGFYGLPTTTDDPFQRSLKKRYGVDVDFKDNHGWLCSEAMRDCDLGYGNSGFSAEVSEAKYRELQTKCRAMIAAQEQAVLEAVRFLGVEDQKAAKFRIYPYEKFSAHIYAIELQRAKASGRESRLKRFEISLTGIRNCKVQAVELLDGIFTPAQMAQIAGRSVTMPRISGPLYPLYMHSRGPTRAHTKKSGRTVRYRHGDDDVRLFFSVLPKVDALSAASRRLFERYYGHVDAVHQVVTKLQRLEWFFMNADLPTIVLGCRDDMVKHLQSLYAPFAKFGEPARAIENTWGNSIDTLFALPRNDAERDVLASVEKANMFLLQLYSASVDETVDAQQPLGGELGLLPGYLTSAQQQEICRLLGRSYLEPEQTPVPRAAFA